MPCDMVGRFKTLTLVSRESEIERRENMGQTDRQTETKRERKGWAGELVCLIGQF